MAGQGGGKAGGERGGADGGTRHPATDTRGRLPLTRRASAARTAAPLLRDLEQAGQGWAGLPHTADLAGLWERHAQ